MSLIILLLILIVIFLVLALKKADKHIKLLEQQLLVQADRQRSVIKGQLAEQLYPASGACPYLPSDMRFLGHPIDYIIFDGLTTAKDGNGDFTEIVFAEIKSGSSKLSPHQAKIKRAVEDGRVRWETIHLESGETRKIAARG